MKPGVLKTSLNAIFKTILGLAGCSFLALTNAGCEDSCVAEFESVELTAKVHSTSGFDWEATVGRGKGGIPPEVVAWEANIADTSSATASSGVLVLNGPGGILYLDVPFPLYQSQTLPVVREDTAALIAASSFTVIGPPRASLGARFDDHCSQPTGEDLLACERHEPAIEGTATVASTRPLILHVDFSIAGGPGEAPPPHLVVTGDLVFTTDRSNTCLQD